MVQQSIPKCYVNVSRILHKYTIANLFYFFPEIRIVALPIPPTSLTAPLMQSSWWSVKNSVINLALWRNHIWEQKLRRPRISVRRSFRVSCSLVLKILRIHLAILMICFHLRDMATSWWYVAILKICYHLGDMQLSWWYATTMGIYMWNVVLLVIFLRYGVGERVNEQIKSFLRVSQRY